VQPQHETSEFSNQDVRPTSSDVSEFFPHEVETDSQKETDRLVLLVGDLERKLVHLNSNHAQVVASLMSELEAAQTKVAEADAAARELLQSSEKQLEQQFKERIEEIKRRSRVRIQHPIPLQSLMSSAGYR
jgi:DNA anti-recombination protein RmuC